MERLNILSLGIDGYLDIGANIGQNTLSQDFTFMRRYRFMHLNQLAHLMKNLCAYAAIFLMSIATMLALVKAMLCLHFTVHYKVHLHRHPQSFTSVIFTENRVQLGAGRDH